LKRRRVLAALGLLCLGAAWPPAHALMPDSAVLPLSGGLDGEQSDRFRAWMAVIVADQLRRGPSPRWFHRDCAGLARFAVTEALREHDGRWRRANGFEGRRLPPDIVLRPDQAESLKGWTTLDGDRQAYVNALTLIQKNSRPIGRESAMARPGDLLFFDQGDDQHLMIWMGDWIAYHNGQPPPLPRTGKAREEKASSDDNGLRAVTPAQLLQWKDTRWRTRDDNPNFAGFYRLAFLSR
jgi:uncharacterized protein